MPPARRDVIAAGDTRPPFRERRACTECRAIKSRCMIQPGWPCCSRCSRLKLPCAFPDHHRGVREAASRRADGTQQPVRESPFSIQSMLSTVPTQASRLLLSTAYATMQDSSDLAAPPSSRVIVPIEDIVASGIFTKMEATQMIQFFYLRLNPIIALLDPLLYSAEVLLSRADYRLLLASICTVSAKFCKPEKYQESLAFLREPLARVASGDLPAQLESVLSLSILSMWKHPGDGTSWRKLRLAVTLAFELGLAQSFKQKNHSRTVMQAQRAFLQLACFEDGYNDQCRMPPSIHASQLPEPWDWIESLGDYVQDIDIRLAASRENALVKQQLVRQLSSLKGTGSKGTLLQRVSHINAAIAKQENNARVWKDPPLFGLPCQHSGRPCLLFHNTNTLFNYHRALDAIYSSPLLPTETIIRQENFRKCCQLAIELFELFNGPYGAHDYYRFVHDIVILNLAVAAVWISDNWQDMPFDLGCQAVAAVCNAALVTQSSLERSMEQSAYLAQFLAFCTTRFSTFSTTREEDTSSQEIREGSVPHVTVGSASSHGDVETVDDSDQQISFDREERAHADVSNYLHNLLTTPCIQSTADVIDTNSILAFLQKPVPAYRE